MQIVVGLILIIVCAGMVVVARPPAGSDSAHWLKSWPIGQTYVLASLITGIVGVGLILNGWPS